MDEKSKEKFKALVPAISNLVDEICGHVKTVPRELLSKLETSLRECADTTKALRGGLIDQCQEPAELLCTVVLRIIISCMKSAEIKERKELGKYRVFNGQLSAIQDTIKILGYLASWNGAITDADIQLHIALVIADMMKHWDKPAELYFTLWSVAVQVIFKPDLPLRIARKITKGIAYVVRKFPQQSMKIEALRAISQLAICIPDHIKQLANTWILLPFNEILNFEHPQVRTQAISLLQASLALITPLPAKLCQELHTAFVTPSNGSLKKLNELWASNPSIQVELMSVWGLYLVLIGPHILFSSNGAPTLNAMLLILEKSLKSTPALREAGAKNWKYMVWMMSLDMKSTITNAKKINLLMSPISKLKDEKDKITREALFSTWLKIVSVFAAYEVDEKEDISALVDAWSFIVRPMMDILVFSEKNDLLTPFLRDEFFKLMASLLSVDRTETKQLLSSAAVVKHNNPVIYPCNIMIPLRHLCAPDKMTGFFFDLICGAMKMCAQGNASWQRTGIPSADSSLSLIWISLLKRMDVMRIEEGVSPALPEDRSSLSNALCILFGVICNEKYKLLPIQNRLLIQQTIATLSKSLLYSERKDDYSIVVALTKKWINFEANAIEDQLTKEDTDFFSWIIDRIVSNDNNNNLLHLDQIITFVYEKMPYSYCQDQLTTLMNMYGEIIKKQNSLLKIQENGLLSFGLLMVFSLPFKRKFSVNFPSRLKDRSQVASGNMSRFMSQWKKLFSIVVKAGITTSSTQFSLLAELCSHITEELNKTEKAKQRKEDIDDCFDQKIEIANEITKKLKIHFDKNEKRLSRLREKDSLDPRYLLGQILTFINWGLEKSNSCLTDEKLSPNESIKLLQSIGSMLATVKTKDEWEYVIIHCLDSFVLWTKNPKPQKNEDVANSAKTLIESLFDCTKNCVEEFNDEILITLTPLLIAGMGSPYKSINSVVIGFWQDTFGLVSRLTYPRDLIPVLAKTRQVSEISLPGWLNSYDDYASRTVSMSDAEAKEPEEDGEKPKLKRGREQKEKEENHRIDEVISPSISPSDEKAQKQQKKASQTEAPGNGEKDVVPPSNGPPLHPKKGRSPKKPKPSYDTGLNGDFDTNHSPISNIQALTQDIAHVIAEKGESLSLAGLDSLLNLQIGLCELQNRISNELKNRLQKTHM